VQDRDSAYTVVQYSVLRRGFSLSAGGD